MIYDCFAFFNELDLLEIRLNELSPVVDKFVLVEATRTFSKEKKPLYYEKNKQRFSEFSDRIIHIVVDKFPGFFYKFRVPRPWDYDNYQKNQVALGLKHCEPDDVIIYSDIDEIPCAEKIHEYMNVPGTKVFKQRLSYYFVNCIAIDCPNESGVEKKEGVIYWNGSVMTKYKDFVNTKELRMRRNKKNKDIVAIHHGGWHFSFLGGKEKVLLKLKAWAHANEKKYNPEYLNDPEYIKNLIESGNDLFGRDYKYEFQKVDASYPKYLLKNRNKFDDIVK